MNGDDGGIQFVDFFTVFLEKIEREMDCLIIFWF